MTARWVRGQLETSCLDIVSLSLVELVMVERTGWRCWKVVVVQVEKVKQRWQFDTRNLKVNFIEVKQTLHFVARRLGHLVSTHAVREQVSTEITEVWPVINSLSSG